MLAAYGWPGNVRELENTICRSMVLCEGEELKAQDLPVRIRSGAVSPAPHFLQSDDLPLCEAVRQATERLEKRIITARLARCGGNRSVTAQSLGISRKTLFNKLRQFDS
jgi:two-component system response regulator AtoC